MPPGTSPSTPRTAAKRGARAVTDPRAAALAVLGRIAATHTTLDALLDESASLTAGLDRRDRALFNQLVYGVLRWRRYLDAVVETYADRPPGKISPAVRDILHLALFQIRFMDRIPPSAAVNTAVNLVRSRRMGRAAGFVNALLRNALRRPDRFHLPDPDTSPVDHIAVAESFPQWLVSRWVDRMGVDETRRLCAAMNRVPPIVLRCNRLINRRSELIAALARTAETVTPSERLPDALHLVGPHHPIAEMKAFRQGRFAVQDEAAQLVSLLLAPSPGETVLDACAGLGGKTMHLAQLMENRGRIVAMDNAATKLERLTAESRRLGITIAQTRRRNLDHPAGTDEAAAFDRILLDAPCTGLGVLRRNPDAKWRLREADIARCAARQARFLDRLAPLLKPGGTLVFAVCSMEPEENEKVISRFLKSHTNFAIIADNSLEAKAVHPFLDADGFLRTAPHTHHMDGFFAARLTRTG